MGVKGKAKEFTTQRAERRRGHGQIQGNRSFLGVMNKP
jgi:hypothetical protein